MLRNIPGRDTVTAVFEAMPAADDFDRIDGDRDYASTGVGAGAAGRGHLVRGLERRRPA